MGKSIPPNGYNGSSNGYNATIGGTRLFDAVDEVHSRELVDRLRDIGLDRFVELPQIAVMGDTSSGKSSLLSALSGVSFPSSDELTTRCPTRLVLTTGATFKGTVHLHRFGSEKNELHDTLSSMEQVPQAIEKLTKLLVDEGQEISDDEIVIELCGPELPNLTLTDLPGIVRAVEDTQDKSIIPRVRELVNRYMKHSRTVILAVVPANVDMHNVEILENAQEADPEGKRTIAVVTKLDLIDAGAERAVEQLLLNRKKRLLLGYHAVKCRGQKDHNDGMTIADGLRKEQMFFKSHDHWCQLPRTSWGIDMLSPRLVKIMQDNIRDSMPVVKKEIQDMMRMTEEQLQSMGSPFDNPGVRRQVFCEWVERFVRPMKAVLKGDYDTLQASDAAPDDEVDMRLRARIRCIEEEFKEKVIATKNTMPGQPKHGEIVELMADDLVVIEVEGVRRTHRVTQVDQNGDIQCASGSEWLGPSRYTADPLNYLRRYIVRNRGDELPIFLPYGVFCSIFGQWVDTWKQPMMDLVAQYYKLTRDVAMRLAAELHATPRVQEFFQNHVEETLNALRGDAECELHRLLAMEHRPYTQNAELTKVFSKMLHPKLETLLKQRLTIGRGNSVDFDSLVNALTEFSRESDEHDTVIMESGLRSYFQVASTRFVDAVPMKLDSIVLEGFVDRMQKELQATSDAKLERLLNESEATRAERSELLDKVETLRAAKRQIEDM